MTNLALRVLVSSALLAAPTAAQVCSSDVLLVDLDPERDGPCLPTPFGAPVVGSRFAFRVTEGAPNSVGALFYSATMNAG